MEHDKEGASAGAVGQGGGEEDDNEGEEEGWC